MADDANDSTLVSAALHAHRRGWTPLPIVGGEKRPAIPGWQHQRWGSEGEVLAAFEGHESVGLALGAQSGGLIDVDLDHPRARRLAPVVLPSTAMKSGRDTSRRSHFWYVCDENMPSQRITWTTPKSVGGEMIVEVRTTGGQTVIPPSRHPSGERYAWHGEPFGGEAGPAVVDGREVVARAATLALVTILSTCWPSAGQRHDAYLALAGALLRDGDRGAHTLWRRNAGQVLSILADAIDDEEAHGRAREVVPSTIRKLEEGRKVQGWPTLAEIVGDDFAFSARGIVAQIEHVLGWRDEAELPSPDSAPDRPRIDAGGDPVVTTTDAGESPSAAVWGACEAGHSEMRPSRWCGYCLALERRGRQDAIIIEQERIIERTDAGHTPDSMVDFTADDSDRPTPTMLHRDDGQSLLYPATVNRVFGEGEVGKTWIAAAAVQECLDGGGRVAWVDTDEMMPDGLRHRLHLMGVDPEVTADVDRLRVFAPQDGIAVGEVCAHLSAWKPDLAVFDGVDGFLERVGINPNVSAEVRSMMHTYFNPITSAGTTVVHIDHVPIPDEGFSVKTGSTFHYVKRRPAGSGAKGHVVRGASYFVETWAKPAPGVEGRLRLILEKDTTGVIRSDANRRGAKGRQPHCGDFVLSPLWPDGMDRSGDGGEGADVPVTWEIRSPMSDEDREAARLQRQIETEWAKSLAAEKKVRMHVAGHDGCTVSCAKDNLTGRLSDRLDHLRAIEGLVFDECGKGCEVCARLGATPNAKRVHVSLSPEYSGEEES